jgi:uncharacterized damage-inducible protein DinB
MYYKIQEFLKDWKQQKETTQKVFNNLTDGSLSQKVYAEGRSLGYIAWHIVISVGEMGRKIGIELVCPPEDAEQPKAAKEIAAAYEKAASTLSDFISKKWNDEKLIEEVNMYGQQWKNGFTLSALIAHEIHHRGQMTVLMRQAGIKVPGTFGPAKEEWAQMGMPSPK